MSANHLKSSSGLHRFITLLPIIGLLWAFLYVRLIDIEVFPYFVDELHHIRRAQIVWGFSDLHISTAPSKFLLYYYLGLFGMPDHLPGWMGRTPVALFALIGAAGTYALARHFFSRIAGWVAILVLIPFPLILFHERMSLTDPFAASIVIVMVWYSLMLARRPTINHARVLGVIICLMLAAKLLAIPLLLMPFLAIILFGSSPFKFNQAWQPQLRSMWQSYKPYLITTFRIVAIVWLVIMVFYVGRGLIDPDNTNPIVDDYIYEAPDRGSVISNNVDHMIEVFRYMWTDSLIILNLIGFALIAWRYPKATLYLIAGIVPLWLSLTITAVRPNSRYLSIVGHVWIVAIGGGVWVVYELLRDWLNKNQPNLRGLRFAPILVVVIWFATAGLSFTETVINEPETLDLPQTEIRGYFANLSGYAITPALQDAPRWEVITPNASEPVVVSVGRICFYYHFYMSEDNPITLECSPYNLEDRILFLNNMLIEYQDFYLLYERAEAPLPVWEEWMAEHAVYVETYERPHDGVPYDIYRVYTTKPAILTFAE